MKTIWKYPLKVCDVQKIRVPQDAVMLSLQAQNGTPCIWAMVNKNDTETVVRTLFTFGTGVDIPGADNLTYIGSYQLLGGDLIYHVFEKN